jgi:hypothetical protein
VVDLRLPLTLPTHAQHRHHRQQRFGLQCVQSLWYSAQTHVLTRAHLHQVALTLVGAVRRVVQLERELGERRRDHLRARTTSSATTHHHAHYRGEKEVATDDERAQRRLLLLLDRRGGDGGL